MQALLMRQLDEEVGSKKLEIVRKRQGCRRL